MAAPRPSAYAYTGLAIARLLGFLRRTRLLAVVWVALMCLNWFEEHYRFMPEIGAIDRFVGDPGAWTRLATLFLSGILFYHWRERIERSARAAAICGVVLALSFAQTHLINIAFPICGTYLVFYVAFHRGLKLQHFGRYGDFSYGLYLYAFPIQQLLIVWFKNKLEAPPVFAVATLLTLPCAIVSWQLVERRFLRRTRSVARNQPDVVIAAPTDVVRA